MSVQISFIGFGEASQALAKGFQSSATKTQMLKLVAYDIKDWDVMYPIYKKTNVEGTTDLRNALDNADLIFCLVTAAQAVAVSKTVRSIKLAGRPLYFDGNSCAPKSKQTSASIINEAGGRYVDAAIMAPVHPRLHQTPMLFSGPDAEQGQAACAKLGMNTRLIKGAVGKASSIKMMRSIAVKGLEALTAELSMAAAQAGVADEVFRSLDASYPDFDWPKRAAYNFERMTQHGIRRAEEMDEVVKTIEDLGISALTSKATSARQRQIGQLGLSIADTAEATITAQTLLKSLRQS